MSLLFELEQHQKLVVYEEGNQILAVRLPLRHVSVPRKMRW